MQVLIAALSSSQNPSGICRHAANLAKGLVRVRAVQRVTLLVGRWQSEYFQRAFQLRDSAVEMVSVPIDNRPVARNRWYYEHLPERASAAHPDIVHLTFPVPFRRSAFSCPVVSSLHDLYPYDLPDN